MSTMVNVTPASMRSRDTALANITNSPGKFVYRSIPRKKRKDTVTACPIGVRHVSVEEEPALRKPRIITRVSLDSTESFGSPSLWVYTEFGEGANVPDDVVRVQIDPSVLEIPPNTFTYKRQLVEVAFHDKLRKIGRAGFSGCSSLTMIELPDCLREIDDMAFFGCTALRVVCVPACVESIRIGYRAFESCNITQYISTAANRDDSWRITQDVSTSVSLESTESSCLTNHGESRRMTQNDDVLLDPFDPGFNNERYDEHMRSRSHRAYGCSQETFRAREAKNKLYLQLIRKNEKLSHLRQYTEILVVPKPADLPSQHALLRGPIVCVSAGHYAPCPYDINCRTFEVHHDTVNAGLVARGLDPLDWLEIADIYSDLFPVVLPYKINIDGKLVKVEYKLFYDPLSTEEKREWDNAETLVVREQIKDAIDEGMIGMNIMAYGAEPRNVYSLRYLAALELEMASRPGGTVIIVVQSFTYDEYVGKWVVVGPDGHSKVCKFVIRIFKGTHHSKLYYPGGATDAEKQEMQDTIIQWQGGLLQGPPLEGMLDVGTNRTIPPSSQSLAIDYLKRRYCCSPRE